jgi:hypothetical protein
MIRTLFLRGIRQHLGLLGSICLGLILFEWAIVWAASQLGMGADFRNILAAFLPSNVVDTVFSQFGFASFEGAISFGYQHPLALIAAVAVVTVMGTLPAHERETALLDLILTRPLARNRYLAAHLLLVLVGAILPPVSLLAGGLLGLAAVDAPEAVAWTRYLPSASAMVLLLLAVGAYVLLFSTGAKRRGVAVAQAIGVTLVFYWLDFMGDYWDLLETARHLSPFHYFDPARASETGLSTVHSIVLLGVSISATAGAFLNFRRQDL